MVNLTPPHGLLRTAVFPRSGPLPRVVPFPARIAVPRLPDVSIIFSFNVCFLYLYSDFRFIFMTFSPATEGRNAQCKLFLRLLLSLPPGKCVARVKGEGWNLCTFNIFCLNFSTHKQFAQSFIFALIRPFSAVFSLRFPEKTAFVEKEPPPPNGYRPHPRGAENGKNAARTQPHGTTFFPHPFFHYYDELLSLMPSGIVSCRFPLSCASPVRIRIIPLRFIYTAGISPDRPGRLRNRRSRPSRHRPSRRSRRDRRRPSWARGCCPYAGR